MYLISCGVLPLLGVIGLVGCTPERESHDVAPIELIQVGIADTGVDAINPFQLAAVGSRIVMVADNQTRLPVLIDASGRLVRTIGRQGPGPGELSIPARAIVFDSTIAIQDLATRQFTMFSHEGEFLWVVERDTTPLPFVSSVITLSGDTLVVSAALQAGAGAGQPFHLVRLGGEVLRSWGAEDRLSTSRAVNDIRYIAPASDTTFWSLKPDTYRVQLWTVAGELMRELRPIGGMDFVDGEPVLGHIDEVRRAPRIASLGTTQCGDIVVVIAMAREDWAPDPSGTGAERPLLPQGEGAKYIYQRIEVLDQQSGVVIAAGEVRNLLISGFMNNGAPFGFRTDEDGRQLAVWWEQIGGSLCKGDSR